MSATDDVGVERSAQQAEAAAAAAELLRVAAAEVPLPATAPVVIADYGAAEGRMDPLRTAVAELRRRDDERAIVVVHTDLPGNDFQSLFEVVANHPDSYRGSNVFTFVVGRSFYEPLFPAATVTLGWSSTAVLWLDAAPGTLDGHQFSFRATGAARDTWHTAASQAWSTFLSQRRAEIVDGGELVVSTLVADPAYVVWMEVVEAGVQDAVSDGTVTAHEHDHMVVPTYLHELDDLLAPVTSQDAGCELVDHVLTVAPDPAFAAYRDHGDAARYARDALAALRAWAGPSLAVAVADRPAVDRAAVMDAVFDRVRARLEAQPTACEWRTVALRLRRRDPAR